MTRITAISARSRSTPRWRTAFALIVEMPGWTSLSEAEQIAVIQAEDAPVDPRLLKPFAGYRVHGLP
jgi:hypothetical protein